MTNLEAQVREALNIQRAPDGQLWLTDAEIARLPAAVARALRVVFYAGAKAGAMDGNYSYQHEREAMGLALAAMREGP